MPTAASTTAAETCSGSTPRWRSTATSNLLVAAGATLANPQLLSPQDNGGPTHTMALPAGSPAIDAGVDGGLSEDQRGEARNGAPDVGAYELQ